ncbi:MAG: HAD family phosphatase [Gammaproteobacteria bacterium]|nr:HAD family phosphatase [Gammaproteobacteria bacterium]
MNRIKLIIFDCDGVIVDSEKITMTIFAQALRELGLNFSLTELFEKFVGPSVAYCNEKVEQLLGRPLPAGFAQRQVALTNEALKTALKPVRGIPDILAQLDCAYCLASNSDHQKITTCLNATNLLSYFSGKIFSAVEDVKREKPAADIYLYAAEKMQSEPDDCLVIEDSPTGVQAAVNAGMTVFGYAECMPTAMLKQAGAQLTFDNMVELPAIINNYFGEQSRSESF